jgi:hypothetical protein
MISTETTRRKILDPRQLLDEAVTESDLQAAVIDLAQLRGWLVHHDRPGATAGGRWATQIQGDAGFPDDLLVRGPRLLVVETKTEKGHLTPTQIRWLTAFEAVERASNGAVEVHLWRPSDWSSGEIERRLS